MSECDSSDLEIDMVTEGDDGGVDLHCPACQHHQSLQQQQGFYCPICNNNNNNNAHLSCLTTPPNRAFANLELTDDEDGVRELSGGVDAMENIRTLPLDRTSRGGIVRGQPLRTHYHRGQESPPHPSHHSNSPHSSLEIDIPHSSPLTSPVLDRPAAMHTGLYSADQRLQQQIASLKHQQQMQQQMLLEQFHEQQRQLAQQHEKQLQEHIKVHMEFIEHQKKLEQQQRLERELLEKERLDQLKNKTKDEESAVASSEVKRRLRECVLTKNQREQIMAGSPTQFQHWGQSSVDGSPTSQSGLSPPYGPGICGSYDDDFPLRKTASEPNILKVRSALKQKVMERRITQSPMLRRRDNMKGSIAGKRKPLSIDSQVCHSNPDSGPNSPPSGALGTLPNGSSLSPHAKELIKAGLGYPHPELSLYTSPSMPNISLGRPPTSGSSASSSTTSSASSDAEVRAIGAARFGLPLTAHMLPPTLPYYPAMPVVNGELPGQQALVSAHMKALEEARQSGKLPAGSMMANYSIPVTGITDSQAAHARLHRHRPLGRTQSAPLPLGHPLLQSPGLLIHQQQQQQHQQEQIIKENQKMYLKQQIRHTVLQRASSKTHMENVDEETEAKLAQEMKESREQEPEVTTLKEDRMDEDQSSDLEKQHHDREAFLLQQRDILKQRHKGLHRPLSRTQSSPLVTFSIPPQQPESSPVRYTFTTGLAYDSIMQKHQCTCMNNSNHPEHAGRLQSIWARLQETGLVGRCERVKSRKATLEELQSCHSEAYSLLYGTNHLHRQKLDPKLLEGLPMRFCLLPCRGVGVDSDTVWNDFHTSNAARMAAGSVTELAMRVATGELKNGLAVVRPPGHHAESQQAMGFCYFNSIAIAAKQLQQQLKLEKILIVDWDVHHGNGTQQMFYSDRSVLYLSIHRHDSGNFFPGTGAPEECGEGEGQGFNVNIAFGGNLSPPMGDGDYLAAFRTVVMPVAREFNPDIVLVSAGFDAATGHDAPLGGYLISPACFGHMTRELMSLAGGKVVLALEGGYDLRSICDACELCTMALLGDDLPPIEQEELCRPPCKPALETLSEVMKIQAPHWPCVKPYAGTIQYSLMEAQKLEVEEADTVTALASLSMVTAKGSMSPESEPMEEES